VAKLRLVALTLGGDPRAPTQVRY